MSDSELAYVRTMMNLLKDTPNLMEHLSLERKKNPNNWRPWVLSLINIKNALFRHKA